MIDFKCRKGFCSGLYITMYFLAALTGFTSCEKSEGKGGTGSISGTITEHFYNDDYSIHLFQAPAVDEEVFIMYGDDNILDDNTFTSPTGEFRLKYLYPGRYHIYYKTQDSTQALDRNVEKSYLVEIGDGEHMDMGKLDILTTLDYNDGTSTIRGQVQEIKYEDESRWPNLVVEYTAPAYEHEIYLTYGNHTYYDKRIRTQHDGTFEFGNLIPGEYLVFLYSEDVTRVLDKVVLKFEVSVTEDEQVVDLGQIIIENI